jgi:hypothetical protein
METRDARPFNRTSLAAGLVFLVLGVIFLLEALDVFDLRGAYVWPVVLIVIGAAVLVSGLRASRRPPPERDET